MKRLSDKLQRTEVRRRRRQRRRRRRRVSLHINIPPDHQSYFTHGGGERRSRPHNYENVEIVIDVSIAPRQPVQPSIFLPNVEPVATRLSKELHPNRSLKEVRLSEPFKVCALFGTTRRQQPPSAAGVMFPAPRRRARRPSSSSKSSLARS